MVTRHMEVKEEELEGGKQVVVVFVEFCRFKLKVKFHILM
jgi:hypothetical protein